MLLKELHLKAIKAFLKHIRAFLKNEKSHTVYDVMLISLLEATEKILVTLELYISRKQETNSIKNT